MIYLGHLVEKERGDPHDRGQQAGQVDPVQATPLHAGTIQWEATSQHTWLILSIIHPPGTQALSRAWFWFGMVIVGSPGLSVYLDLYNCNIFYHIHILKHVFCWLVWIYFGIPHSLLKCLIGTNKMYHPPIEAESTFLVHHDCFDLMVYIRFTLS